MPEPIRDPYEVLGLRAGASQEQLREAYRRLVQLNHPDHNPGDADAARRFEEIQEAYARVRQLRQKATAAPPPSAAADPQIEARLAELERELQAAHAARQRAQRAAREAAAGTERPSDEELGYVVTDDSLGKIIADARAELSGWLGNSAELPASERVADLLEELAAKLKGDATRR